MTEPFVVIGGDAAGLSAASKLRREDPDRDVIVFEKGDWVSYAHCGMPYYVKGAVDSLTDLLSLTPDEIDDRGIDLRRGHEVVGVDTADRTVTVQHESGESVQPYGDLLIATGAHAIRDPIPGTALDCAFTMHHMDSAAAIRAYLTPPGEAEQLTFQAEAVNLEYVTPYLDRVPPASVAIVGGGYVGVEMAEAFSAHEVDVHLFQRSEDLLPPFGAAVAEQIEETLRSHGVTLHLGTEVQELEGDQEVRAVRTREERIPTDLALVGIGIRPNTQILEGTPIELGVSGAVRTDPYGRTSVEGVYAAGDCAEMEHTVTGEPAWVPLGLTANRAGRAIGQTIAGAPSPVGTVAGTAVVKAFEQECGRTGLVDPNRADDAGFTPVSETITASSRSGYYPGAKPTTVTLVADADSGRLLGGSIVGPDRAAIRIDTLATALDQNMEVAELERLDLAYAPPFSPVWDPILVAAKVLNGSF
jgi:NADPH-dependent 2,4-dienoyl-CoA reductase/sulfur reductase-like enzyme